MWSEWDVDRSTIAANRLRQNETHDRTTAGRTCAVGSVQNFVRVVFGPEPYEASLRVSGIDQSTGPWNSVVTNDLRFLVGWRTA